MAFGLAWRVRRPELSRLVSRMSWKPSQRAYRAHLLPAGSRFSTGGNRGVLIEHGSDGVLERVEQRRGGSSDVLRWFGELEQGGDGVAAHLQAVSDMRVVQPSRCRRWTSAQSCTEYTPFPLRSRLDRRLGRTAVQVWDLLRFRPARRAQFSAVVDTLSSRG
jgi:hypothetical protein